MLIYKKHPKEIGKVAISEVALDWEKPKTTQHIVKLFDVFDKTVIPYLLRLKNDEILVTGNASSIGNGIFKDNVFSKYQALKPLSKKDNTFRILKYDKELLREEEPKILLKEGIHIPLFNSHEAYSYAYNELSSSIGILTEEVRGSGIYSAAGSISKCQEDFMRKTGMEILEIHGKKANFIVTPELFEQITAEFARQKDMYIEFSGIAKKESTLNIKQSPDMNTPTQRIEKSRP